MTRSPDGSGDGGDEALDSLFSCLADGDRRRILGLLYDRAPDPLTRRDLATARVPFDRGRPRKGELRRAFVALHHVHLPKLEAAGLIDRDADRGAVGIADHPAFRDTGIVDVVRDEESADTPSLDALFRALADHRRRIVLDALSHQYGSIHAETLARELGAAEGDTSESAVPAERVDRILASLRHVHLPHLAEAGLIEYDAEEGTVAYEGHPDLRVPWMHSALGPEFRASLTGESAPQEVGTIEGRENVVSFGQSLCDRVDEELLCMFTATGLLEAGCFTRIRDASRRGVDVYLATRDPTVREYVREHAPEVVLWEPDTDWIDMPVVDTRVGRLLLADREAVMLGTLGEEDEDGVREEKAIVGEGADNTLVVMIRQLLSSRLERIDEGAEDAESFLPF